MKVLVQLKTGSCDIYNLQYKIDRVVIDIIGAAVFKNFTFIAGQGGVEWSGVSFTFFEWFPMWGAGPSKWSENK